MTFIKRSNESSTLEFSGSVAAQTANRFTRIANPIDLIPQGTIINVEIELTSLTNVNRVLVAGNSVSGDTRNMLLDVRNPSALTLTASVEATQDITLLQVAVILSEGERSEPVTVRLTF